jgi:hypothetical protein
VFTPAWTLEAMLDLVQNKETERIDSGFFEQFCRCGTFLVQVPNGPIHRVAVVGSVSSVEEGRRLLDSGRRACPRASSRGADARSHRWVPREEMPVARTSARDTIGALLRRDADGSRGGEVAAGLDRRTINYNYTTLHHVFKDTRPLGSAPAESADTADPRRSGRMSDGAQAWAHPPCVSS